MIGEHRIGVHHPLDRRFARAQSEGEIGLIIADPHRLDRTNHAIHAGLAGGAHGHQVARLFDAPAHRLRSGTAAGEVAEAFLAQPRALINA